MIRVTVSTHKSGNPQYSSLKCVKYSGFLVTMILTVVTQSLAPSISRGAAVVYCFLFRHHIKQFVGTDVTPLQLVCTQCKACEKGHTETVKFPPTSLSRIFGINDNSLYLKQFFNKTIFFNKKKLQPKGGQRVSLKINFLLIFSWLTLA